MSPNGEVSFEPLSPVSFLDRAAAVYADRIAVVDGDHRWTYREFRQRCGQLAGALSDLAQDHPVAILAPNTHVMLEAHFGVPWAGVPLVTINTRLAAAEMRYIVEHCGARTLIYDSEYEGAAKELRAQLGDKLTMVRAGQGDRDRDDALPYEDMLAQVPIAPEMRPADERGLLSINYTSGTTGRPKGVMYHHRGAYLQALAMVAHTQLTPASAFLWTLPMFHCNGWTFPWAVTAAGATHVCLRRVDAAAAWQLIAKENVTTLGGAPAVLSMLIDECDDQMRPPRDTPVRFLVGGAPPTPTMLSRAESVGIDITQVYGLTETYGPAMITQWLPEWAALPPSERARVRARQGITNIAGVHARVVTADGADVPPDGQTIGEIALRGNYLMLGYLRDEVATAAAIPDGWFRSGDLGVMHPDGYIELRDRKKDVIISGGENITSIEVEQAICSHPAVHDAAVVGIPDERWGEVPIAFVHLRQGLEATESEIIDHVRERLARFKAPKRIIFGDLPRTSTGKVQKFALRDLAAL